MSEQVSEQVSEQTLEPSIKHKRGVAIALALCGILCPGLHKFYLRQWRWGLVYLCLWPTHIPQVASFLEGLWFGVLDEDEFRHNFQHTLSFQVLLHWFPALSLATPGISQGNTAQQMSAQPPGGRSLASPIAPIDVNRATLEDWQQIPWLTDRQRRSLLDLQTSGVQLLCLEDLAAALSVPVTEVQPWASKLQFCYYDRSPTAATELPPPPSLTPICVNPNTASIAALTRIPGISVALALQLVHHRTPPYRDLADVQQRLALSAPQVEALLHHLRFE